MESVTKLQAWGRLVSPEEKNRVNKIERLDEMEVEHAHEPLLPNHRL